MAADIAAAAEAVAAAVHARGGLVYMDGALVHDSTNLTAYVSAPTNATWPGMPDGIYEVRFASVDCAGNAVAASR